MTTEKRTLPVQLTEVERNERGRQASRHIRHYRALEEKKKEVTKAFSDGMKEARRQAEIAAAAAETGMEEREVECRVEIRGMQRTVIRTDNGEIVEDRVMTEDEIERLDAHDESDTETKPRETRVGRKKPPAPLPN